jgi:hypothetical protein
MRVIIGEVEKGAASMQWLWSIVLHDFSYTDSTFTHITSAVSLYKCAQYLWADCDLALIHPLGIDEEHLRWASLKGLNCELQMEQH